jgi:hypothetical protein
MFSILLKKMSKYLLINDESTSAINRNVNKTYLLTTITRMVMIAAKNMNPPKTERAMIPPVLILPVLGPDRMAEEESAISLSNG